MLLQALSNYEIVIGLVILGGGLLVAAHEQDNSKPSPTTNTRIAQLIAEDRRRVEEGITTQRN